MRCGRELEARIADRAADPIAALAHARVRQADHRGTPAGRTRRRPRPGRCRPRCRTPPPCARTRARGAIAASAAAGGFRPEITAVAKTTQRLRAESAGSGEDSARLRQGYGGVRRSAWRGGGRVVRAIFSRVPGAMWFDRSRFRLLILATVVSNSRAIDEERVAPLDPIGERLPMRLRLAPERADVAPSRRGCARPRHRRRTGDGRARRLARRCRAAVRREQRRRRARDDELLAGCARFDFVDRLFASARSARLTFSLRAIVASDSPVLTVYHFSDASSAGDGCREPRWRTAPPCPPAPSSRSRILQRRRPAPQLRVQRLDFVDRCAGPLGDAAQIDGARHRDLVVRRSARRRRCRSRTARDSWRR